jgi:16S rRNA (guanine966-N2)-methyltransferase
MLPGFLHPTAVHDAWSQRTSPSVSAVTRIVGGSVGGRRIATPPGRATRPTSDRAREGLFSALEALRGPLSGARVLDLYAGSGALGLEAWSRGAAAVTFVESDARTAAVIRTNATDLGYADPDVRREPVERFVAREPTDRFDLVFLDAPYAEPVSDVVARLGSDPRAWLADGGVTVVERSARDPDFPWPQGFEAVKDLRYGEARVWLALWYRRRS